ncbi:hypothetical protein TWF718_007570 [Orbilia javanica]|uniref:F-box domain-containing protein n=1 Tax=Orbilia javanica TaxID=47235 RepID=A0AAN8MTQ9_9PEZI
MGLTNLPPELLGQVALLLDSLRDLASLALVNKVFSDVVRPHFCRFITFGLPPEGRDWSVKNRFDSIPERHLRRIKHIEVIHSSRINRWGSSDVDLGFWRYKSSELDENYNVGEGYETAPTTFNKMLAELIGNLRPGQLESFRFNRHSCGRVSHRTDIDIPILAALTNPETRLTRLDLAFDPCLESEDCSIFNFPHLIYFSYKAYNVSSQYHRIFSLLSSCQDTLEEFHASNWRPHASEPSMLSGFRGWRGCENCRRICRGTGLSGGKRIHLKSLKKWKLHGSSLCAHNMLALYHRESILDKVPVLKYGESSSIGFTCADGGSGLDWKTCWQYLLYQYFEPREKATLSDFLEVTTGFEKVTFSKVCSAKSRWDWIEGLKKGHQKSLRRLKLKSCALSADEEDVEYIGNSFPDLEELTVEMKDSIGTDFIPDCVFDKSIFPSLKVFRSTGAPSKEDTSFREKICQKILSSLLAGKLSSNIQKIYVGTANYLFIIDREARTSNNDEIEDKSEIQDRIFEGGLTVDEGLAIYGLRVTEIKNQNRRTLWKNKVKEVYEPKDKTFVDVQTKAPALESTDTGPAGVSKPAPAETM